MLTSQPRYLALLLVFVIPVVIFFRSNISETYTNSRTGQAINAWSKNAILHNNASSFEHSGIADETSEGGVKMAQVSMQYGDHFDLMYERGLRTHLENGEKWGYPTHFLRHDIVGGGDVAQGMYDKLLYLQTIMVNEMTKNFGKRAEWLVWFDADTILLNNQVPWTVFLPPSEGLFRDINMLVSRDWSGFNAGVFLIRVCEWSVHALADAIALPRLRPEVELVFREQDALRWVFDQPGNKKHRIYQPRHWFNVYDNYYEGMGDKPANGSICVHFPGMGGARPDAMGRWLDKIENTPEVVHVPLEETRYPSEIKVYWDRLRTGAEALKKSRENKEHMDKGRDEMYLGDQKRIITDLDAKETELHTAIEDDAADAEKLGKAVDALTKQVESAAKQFDESKKRKIAANKKKEDDEKKKEEESKAAEAKAAKEKEEKAQAEKAAKAMEKVNAAANANANANASPAGQTTS